MSTLATIWIFVIPAVLFGPGIILWFRQRRLKLRPYVKALWVDALRNGEYKYAKGQLQTNQHGFCVWGVLCDLHSRHHSKPWVVVNLIPDSQFPIYEYRYLGRGGIPPREVLDWAFQGKNIHESQILLDYPQVGKMQLLYINDNYNTSYAELADLIEEQL